MTDKLARWLPSATLLAWAAVLLYFHLSGRILPLLHPAFRPGVLVAGLILLVMSGLHLWLPVASSCCEEDQCGHPLARMTTGRFLTFLILLVPIVSAAMFSPAGFSLSTIENRGVITDARHLAGRAPMAPDTGANATGEKPGAQRTVDVVELLYAAQDATLRADFEHQKVELLGQLMPDQTSNAGGRRFKLVRMLMTCCAADARPVAVVVESRSLPEMPEMSWIKVGGEATFPFEGGRTIALVRAESVSPTEPPDESMIY